MSKAPFISIIVGNKSDRMAFFEAMVALLFPVCVVSLIGGHWAAQVVVSLFGLLFAIGVVFSRGRDQTRSFDNAEDACEWVASKFSKEGASE